LFLSLGYSPPTIFWITIAVSFLNQPLSMYLLHKNFDYSYSEYMKKVIFPCFLFTLISPILPWILHSVIEPSFFRLVIVVISSILISAMVAYFIVLSLSERQIVNTLIRKIIKH
jgi:hypothetical protein